MIIITNILIGILIINISFWLGKLRLSHDYIKRATQTSITNIANTTNMGPSVNIIKFVLVIPVLNEVKRINDAIEMCSGLAKYGVEVIFATSSKEKKLTDQLNTIEIIEQFEEKYSWLHSYQYVGEGYMAHQLNYAIRCYSKEHVTAKNIMFGVYNIDSVIEPKILNWVFDEYQKSKKKKVIYQQYGCYCKNWNDCVKLPFLERGILLSNMLWQTRWSVGFEMAHALIGLKLCKKNIWYMNYCIGHGLFFDLQTYEQIGGFEEQTLNEDAVFGLQACLNNIQIIPIPWLESSDSPDFLSSLFRQKITWVYGPGQAFYYGKLIKERSQRFKDNSIRLSVLCLQLFEHAVRWVVMPILVIFAIIFSFGQSFIYGVGMFALILFYLAGISLINAYSYKMDICLTVKDIFAVMVGCIPQFILHGLSGVIGLQQLLAGALFHKKVEKRKTEMRG